MTRKLLLCSSSKAGDSAYLEPVVPHLQQRIAAPAQLLFIPYAGVGMSYDDYTAKVTEVFAPLGYQVQGVHQAADKAQAIANTDAILVGGGNTFHLLAELQRQHLVQPLQQAVAAGVTYIGWSAGSNIAGLSIRTTNDMPIIEPESFNALALVPFQLNPHYTDYQPPGFHGETRDQRLAEFMALDAETAILAIREGSALLVDDQQMQLLGTQAGVVFQAGEKAVLPCNSDISSWLLGK